MNNLSNNPLRYSQEACGGDPQKLLCATEREWLEFEQLFLSHGYRLGGRLSPDWVPSWWKNPDLKPYQQIDFSTRLSVYVFADAYRVTDGSLVAIQKVSVTPNSRGIVSFLNSPELRDNPRNHTIPLLDSFPHPSNSEIHFHVTPLLRSIDSPPFEFIGEIIDCIDQLLEGLVFFHENGIFIGNIDTNNVAMNDSMFPDGVHPHRERYLPDGKTPSRRISRLEGGVKYYYIHFHSSGYMLCDGPPLITRLTPYFSGGPEISYPPPWNPYKADVFSLGIFIKKFICRPNTNVGFIRPLVDRMTVNNAGYRPTAQQALEAWKDVRSGVWKIQAAWRVHYQYDDVFLTTMSDTVSVVSSLAKWINPLRNA